MSRYSIPATDPALTCVVGYDPPLETYFAQVEDPSDPDETTAMRLWLGCAPQAIPTVVQLVEQLSGWAIMPQDIWAHLIADQSAAAPPTPLQRMLQDMMRRA